MSINVNLKRITNLPGRSDRKVELSFRGFNHKTKILQCENVAVFNEHFRWPHYGDTITDEALTVSVFNCSKVFSNRLLGKLVISLQHVVSTGRLLLREPLNDTNLSQTDVYIELEVTYRPLQGAAGHWEGEEFLQIQDYNSSGLVIQNRAFDDGDRKDVSWSREADREARRLGRSLLPSGEQDDDDDDDLDDDDFMDLETANISFTPLLSRCRPISRHVVAAMPRVQSFQVNVNILEGQRLVGVNINPVVFVRIGNQKKHTATQKSTNCPFYSENFMFEFHETADSLFDKVVEIRVFHRRMIAFLLTHIGMFKIDLATVYNQPDHRFYLKWAPLCDPEDTRSGVKGYIKATLSIIEKGDALSMPSLGSAPSSEANEDIEKNLLLPKGFAPQRPWARFRVRVYRAEGLPSMGAGLLAGLARVTDRKVFIDPYVHVCFSGQQGETSVVSSCTDPVWNEEISFLEQFPPLARRIRIRVLDDANIGEVTVATHFLDLQAISNPTRNGFHPMLGPCWINLYGSPQNSTLGDVHQALNEGLGEGIFYRGRLLLSLSVDVFLSPSAVAEETGSTLNKMKGAFKGLKRKRSSKQSKQAQGAGGEEPGESMLEVPEAVTVEIEEIHPLPEGFLGDEQEYLLFASLFEVTMMEPSVGNRPLTFELSIGNYGKAVEVARSKPSGSKEELRKSREELRRSREQLNEEVQSLLESENEFDREEMLNPEPENRSLSSPMRTQPTENDRSFRYIPLQPPAVRLKPCLFVWSHFEDQNFRLYQSNWLHKMANRLDLGLDEAERLWRRPGSKWKERLMEVMLELITSCKQFSMQTDRRSACRPNGLDRCRKDFIKSNIVLLARQAVRVKRRATRQNARQKFSDAKKMLKKIRFLAEEPQKTLPDVFLWLLNGKKRLAYVRIPTYSIIFSLVEEQKGQDCGKVTTLYMKAPGAGSSQVFCKLEAYLWLGLTKYCKEALHCLPEDFLPVYQQEHKEEESSRSTVARKDMPLSLSCQDSRYFQLRCHIYQGRGLVAADDNGLSDPFARVLFSTQCQVTRVLMETLSPAWSECLLFDRVLLEGSKENLKEDPPIIIIHLFDYDVVGAPDPLGMAFAAPELKFAEEPYEKPRLSFYDITRGRAPAGELLAAFELIELDYSGFGEPTLPTSVDPQQPLHLPELNCYIIPDGVRPTMCTFRIEVLFWGLRDLRRVQLFEVERPLVKIECGGSQLESEEMISYKTHPNFKETVRYIDVELPEQAYLHPPLTVFVVEQRAFGRTALVGTHVVQCLMAYALHGEEPDQEEEEEPKPRVKVAPPPPVTPLNTVKSLALGGLSIKQSKIPFNPLNLMTAPLKKLKLKEELEEETPEKEELDWWSKYYASLDELEKEVVLAQQKVEQQAESDTVVLTMASIEEDEDEVFEIEPPKPKRKKIATLKLYSSDLESQFNQFQDWLHIFPLVKGRSAEEDEDEEDDRFMGKYKGSFLVYPLLPGDEDERCRITDGLPQNSPLKVLMRLYIVKATTLAPTDPNGKSDPYLKVRVGAQHLDSKDRYIPKQLNPVFGEVFELTVSFPLETELVITVMDHDLVGADDVIGETRVDLENRFYSRHRAGCGLALYYDMEGYNRWRDTKKPAAILSELCEKNSIPSPEYRLTEVKVLNKIYRVPPDAFPEELSLEFQGGQRDVSPEKQAEQQAEREQHAALSVLHRWAEMSEFLPGASSLVPEHMEVRTLLNPDRPGLPQGYLHMWIDLFPTDIPAPPPVDIKPRLPVEYEMRVIIWNTDDVVLDDVNPFTGIPSSDIYVKGWIKGLENEKQETDVHFNSLTGEGNFNWRFIFRFNYLPTEKEVVYMKKESIFSLEASEFRQPAVLVLQVWDYDRIGANDFLGSLELPLGQMVRPAKSSDTCSIQMAKDRVGPRASIFRSKRLKGWWPLLRARTQEEMQKEKQEQEEAKKKGKKNKKKDRRSRMKPEDIQFTDPQGITFLLTGKVEAELQLVTLEEADLNPVGRGRKEPEPLDKPDRPRTTFSWFVNPMKTFIFFIWRKYKKFIIAFVILVILALFLALILYTMPQQISALIVNG